MYTHTKGGKCEGGEWHGKGGFVEVDAPPVWQQLALIAAVALFTTTFLYSGLRRLVRLCCRSSSLSRFCPGWLKSSCLSLVDPKHNNNQDYYAGSSSEGGLLLEKGLFEEPTVSSSHDPSSLPSSSAAAAVSYGGVLGAGTWAGDRGNS